jgi:hypothetical protein
MQETTHPAGPSTSDPQRAEAAAESRHLSYEGTSLPTYVVLIWLLFLGFGFFYFAAYLL